MRARSGQRPGAHVGVAPRARPAARLERVGEGEGAAVAHVVRVERELSQPRARMARAGLQRARELLGAAVAHAVAAEPEALEPRRGARQQRRGELGGAVVADLVVVEPELHQVRQPARTHRARDRARRGVTQPVAAQVKLGELGRRAARQRVGEQRAAALAHGRAEPEHLEPRRAVLAQRQRDLGRRRVVHVCEPQLSAPAQPPQRAVQRREGPLATAARQRAQQLGAAQVQVQGRALLGGALPVRAHARGRGRRHLARPGRVVLLGRVPLVAAAVVLLVVPPPPGVPGAAAHQAAQREQLEPGHHGVEQRRRRGRRGRRGRR